MSCPQCKAHVRPEQDGTVNYSRRALADQGSLTVVIKGLFCSDVCLLRYLAARATPDPQPRPTCPTCGLELNEYGDCKTPHRKEPSGVRIS